jgi:O-antigen ligase
MPASAAPKIVPGPERRIAPQIVPDVESTQERIVTLVGGWKLFREHPVFGAGLGAFRNQMIISSTTGIPLLIHSTALWLLAELGAVGFLIFAVPAVFLFVREWRRSGEDETSKFIVLCCIAFAIMAGPADMLYQRTFWIVIGAALALPPETMRMSQPAIGA